MQHLMASGRDGDWRLDFAADVGMALEANRSFDRAVGRRGDRYSCWREAGPAGVRRFHLAARFGMEAGGRGRFAALARRGPGGHQPRGPPLRNLCRFCRGTVHIPWSRCRWRRGPSELDHRAMHGRHEITADKATKPTPTASPRPHFGVSLRSGVMICHAGFGYRRYFRPSGFRPENTARLWSVRLIRSIRFESSFERLPKGSRHRGHCGRRNCRR